MCRPNNFQRNQWKFIFNCSNLLASIENEDAGLILNQFCSRLAIVHSVSPFLFLSSSFSSSLACTLVFIFLPTFVFFFWIDAIFVCLQILFKIWTEKQKNMYNKKFGHTLTSPSELRWCFFLSRLTFSVGAAVVNDVVSIKHYIQLNKITPPSRQLPNDFSSLSFSLFMCVHVFVWCIILIYLRTMYLFALERMTHNDDPIHTDEWYQHWPKQTNRQASNN